MLDLEGKVRIHSIWTIETGSCNVTSRGKITRGGHPIIDRAIVLAVIG